jgi:hypothetical protein
MNYEYSKLSGNIFKDVADEFTSLFKVDKIDLKTEAGNITIDKSGVDVTSDNEEPDIIQQNKSNFFDTGTFKIIALSIPVLIFLLSQSKKR